ncbi:hypothetical protein IE077_002032 [Cardiosporidium cionae]|uniref:Uncharacterized protein n=1 Tax=Cardiosporidium cionae TaxID=476202 RepID=A0ABQ7JBQ0_9APIC|nr:hypothetical protein IE077_002032 [Cardiosporidium cionae]|eukprot:KAF8821428.1 hypothetical protein IE077_002032 [Cardiosporidium cionae]
MKIPRLTSISSFLGLTRNVRIYPAVNHRFPGKSLTVHKDPAELSALKYARIHAVGNASSQCSVANSSPFIPRVSERIIAHRKSLNYKIWQAILRKDWNEWEELLSEYKKHNLPRDEVSYTLQMFGFLFSHRHSSENAYLVVDEMKQASLESSIVDLNEGLLNALFELQGIYCNGPTEVPQIVSNIFKEKC